MNLFEWFKSFFGGRKKKKPVLTRPIIVAPTPVIEPLPTGPAPEPPAVPEPLPPLPPMPEPPVITAPTPLPAPPPVPPVIPPVIPETLPPITPPTRQFHILNATRFPGNPDMSAYGLERVRFVYTSELFGADTSQPDPKAIAAMVAKAKREKFSPYGLILDIEHWKLDVAEPDPSKHISVVNLTKEEWSGVPVSYYGEVPIRDGTSMNGSAAVTPDRMAAWRKQNDALAPLAAVVDALYPSCYPLYSSMVKWGKFANAMVAESIRVGKGLPIYPVLWIDWHANSGLTGRVPQDVFLEMLRTVYESGADGVCIWSMAKGSVNFDPDEGWMRAIQQLRKDRGLV